MIAAPTISAKAKERPILFSAPMVKAILAGTKSQTRRAMNPQPMPVSFAFTYKGVEWGEKTARPRNVLSLCPYGQPGDRLWVKETWGYNGCFSGGEKCEFGAYVTYHADGTKRTIPFPSFEEMMAATPAQNIKTPAGEEDLDRFTQQARRSDRIGEWWRRSKKRPSIHMPRWASRLTLEIVAVRVERLTAISEADAKAEGAPEPTGRIGGYPAPWATGKPGPISYRQTFQKIWEGINGKDSWTQSPWVWVVEFKRLTQ